MTEGVEGRYRAFSAEGRAGAQSLRREHTCRVQAKARRTVCQEGSKKGGEQQEIRSGPNQWGLIGLWIFLCVRSHWRTQSQERTRSGGRWRVGMHEILPWNLSDAAVFLSHYLSHCLLRISHLLFLQRTSFSPRALIQAVLLVQMLSDHFSHGGLPLTFWSQLKLHLFQELASYATYRPTILSQLFSTFLHGIDLYPRYLFTYLTTICNSVCLFVYLVLVYLPNQNVDSIRAVILSCHPLLENSLLTVPGKSW